MSYHSPSGSTPGQHEYYYEGNYASPSPTPSPGRSSYYYAGAQTPARPATRAHFRGVSSGTYEFASPRTPAFSPRYTSTGQYATATANVSSSRSSRPQRHHGYADSRPRRERRHSASYYRASDLRGESDEDEFIEIHGVTWVLPARSRTNRYPTYHVNTGGYETDYRYYTQTAASVRQPFVDRDPMRYSAPRYERDPVPDRRPTVAPGHSRRTSAAANIARPQTARPTARQASAATQKKPPAPKKATLEDARKHMIPEGYSLKNWDPSEDPILLLGSVFDGNSLGKWIYDWTVSMFEGTHPISELAGELWMLLIQLFGKVKKAEENMPKIRSAENREIIEDFIESGERLTDKLRKLLKACEAPMLMSSSNSAKDKQLGRNAGVEFVNTLWGRDRQLENTERFMASVRLWNLRFDANCNDILKAPTM